MEFEELIGAVGRFGLSSREARLYLALVRRGRATARELAHEAGVDRVLGYRMLDSLRSRGIVEVTAERPRRYAPVPPRALFERSLRERGNLLTEDRALAETLAEQLPALVREADDLAPRFQVLQGTPAIFAYLREMLRRAQQEVCAMVTHRALRGSVEYGLPVELPRLLKGGGRFRLIVESDPRVRRLVDRFGRVSRRYPLAELRQLSPQPTRLTLVDRREAMLFLVPEARTGQVEELAVWTNNPSFVLGQLHYFNIVWDAAGSATLRPPPMAVVRPAGGVRVVRSRRKV
ncbi:MAG TPA: helix-turn-helix domain-containing protein [Thermoplasmata archaeon]|nr:helix-turn-helix domain-containing protein [Thermoplasmata archaeon]